MHVGGHFDNPAIGSLDAGGKHKMKSDRGSATAIVERKGFLDVRAYKGRPFYEARWRDLNRRERRRRLGPAWLERDDNGDWVPRRGRVRDGHLDARRAYPLMAEVIEAHEAELRDTAPPAVRDALFDEAVAAWLKYLRREKRVKPSTLAGYRSLLAEPTGKRKARIMRKFGGRQLFSITTRDILKFLRMLDDEDISARTVNIHRQVLHSIFEFARREDAFGLLANPAAGTTKRPEDGAQPIDTFEPDEILRIANAAHSGLHRGRGGYAHSAYSAETEREWWRTNEQDAALFTVAAFTGLRLGELLALRWRDIDFRAGIVIVSRAMSDGEETSTKSRRSRTVPLAQQARDVLVALHRRDRFVGRDDFVFCRDDGEALDRSAVRKRFIRAQKKAGVRARRFHDLRHTFGSLAIRRFDLVAVKEMMGHSKLTTTERYVPGRRTAEELLDVGG